MKKATLAILISGICTSISSWAFGPPKPYTCYPRGDWKTVDTFLPGPTLSDASSHPNSAASNSKTDFIAGDYIRHDRSIGYRWVVRKSSDRGETWSTADEFYIAENQDTQAVGVATNRINDDVYVVGKTLWQYEAYPTHGWIVRKSSDHGTTWSTVDDLTVLGRGVPYVRAISVAAGIIHTVGVNIRSFDDSIPPEVILRRSENDGASWSTIDLTLLLQDVVSISASADGSVFITGKGHSPAGQNWVVIHSPNGKDSWKAVDVFTEGSEIQGSTISAILGRISVFGTSQFGTRWTVREALSSSPIKWTTIDSFRPEVIDGKGLAIAGAGTYSKAGFIMTGNLFVVGAAKFPLRTFPTYLTRRRLNPTSKTFVVSDEYDEVYNHKGALGSKRWAATTTDAGDILTATAHPNPAGNTAWLVRKLTCRPF